MRSVFIKLATVLALLSAPAPAFAQSDILAPAREGQVQCYEPNAAAKTCQSIGGYTFDAQGGILSVGDAMIMDNPLIVMNITTAVTIRNGAVCGPMTQADLERATFTIDNAPATPEQTQNIRTSLAQQIAPMLNVDICTTYVPVDGGGFRAEATMNGTPRPDMTQPVIWVRPGEGWRVAP